jgi:hypothetical protein
LSPALEGFIWFLGNIHACSLEGRFGALASESSDSFAQPKTLRLVPLLTIEERAGLRSIVSGSNLDEDEVTVVALSLCYRRVRLSAELIHEARDIFARKPMTRSRIVAKMGNLTREGHELHSFAESTECCLNDLCKRYFGENVFRSEWAHELGGRPEQRLESGIADIMTSTNVYEVKDISQWKHAIGQAIIYANKAGLKPGLALFGPELEVRDMEALRRTASDMGVELLLKVWKQDKRPHEKPSERIVLQGSSSVHDFLNRIEQYELRKKEIAERMDEIVQAFGLTSPKAWAVGCLRLEEIYCTKGGTRYGPYGPYYYLYSHRAGKLEKKYLGKSAEKFEARRDAVTKLRQLEAEYRRILKSERQMVRDELR